MGLLFWRFIVRVFGIWFIAHEEFSVGLLAVGGGLVDALLKGCLWVEELAVVLIGKAALFELMRPRILLERTI